jgi:TonB family protein
MIHRNRKLSVWTVVAAVLTASAVLAEEPDWQEVASNPEVIVEVDAANIRVREDKLTAWVRVTTLHDIGTEGTKFRSAVSLTVFDCDAEKSGMSTTTMFAGPRGEGKMVRTEEGLPVPIAQQSYERPGTGGYKVLKFVCERSNRPSNPNAEADESQFVEAQQATRAREDAEPVRDVEKPSAPAKVTLSVNFDDYYPPGSIRRQEQGSPVVMVCVEPSGRMLREPLVTDTSGFPDLDGAAIKVAKAMRYSAGTENGAAVPESCLKFRVKFSLNNH